MTIEDLKNVPQKPGVYLWKNLDKQIIYVGKAKNLKTRMTNYFKGMTNSYKTQHLVALIDSFEYIITNSEKEALILERNLIEKNAPQFNILLTDDKRYPYVRVALGTTLSISLAFRVRSQGDKAFYYGPFPTGFGAKKMVDLLTRIALYEKGIPIKNPTVEMLKAKFLEIKKILNSNNTGFIKELEARREEATKNTQYEIAGDIQKSIETLQNYQDTQVVELQDKQNIDFIYFLEKGGFLSISLLFYRQGILLSKKDLVIEIVTSLTETTRQFINQYYGLNIIPNLIVTNLALETEIKTLIPKGGKFKSGLEIARKNAEDNIESKLSSYIRHEEITLGAMNSLNKILGTKISHIVMVDNSHTANTQPVSVFVSYRNGVKIPREYRKYKIETNNRLSDLEYMRQGVEKYFANRNNAIPELLIVDGGVQQTQEIRKILPKQLIIGLVKDDNHQTKYLIDLNEKKTEIDDLNLFNFLKGIQIEVDRYAKSYHRKIRTLTLEGKLAQIDGIGPKTETKLLEHFKTYSAIYNASIADLEKIVSKELANKIKKGLEETWE